MPIDAERWLAARGVERESLAPEAAPDGQHPSDALPPRAREVLALARQVAEDREALGGAVDAPSIPSSDPTDGRSDDPSRTTRSDDVEAALAFVRRSTANAPQSEGRLRSKLSDRGHDEETVDRSLALARGEGLVDDGALLAALVAERRARGHADARLRRDLRDRGFTGEQVDTALDAQPCSDPAAAAFALAREHAARHRGVDPEAAVRRTVGALVRRGHGEGLARKAARDAVYADRETERIAGR